jgi:hypothetical protein
VCTCVDERRVAVAHAVSHAVRSPTMTQGRTPPKWKTASDLRNSVGLTGFEPATPCSRTWLMITRPNLQKHALTCEDGNQFVMHSALVWSATPGLDRINGE